jgi:NitT/TauT family transport system permease protein
MYSPVPAQYYRRHSLPLGDVIVALLVGFFIYGTIATAQRWSAVFQPAIEIDLSAHALPMYAIYSLFRALIAYGLSLMFTLIMGYWAAKSRPAERVILPLLDIGQSIPVLGFLPGLVLGLIAIFPRSNLGLELSCIVMIFTGQVWNMTFSYYSSLKAVPNHLFDLSQNVRFSPLQRLFNIELPYSSSGLAWNSLMSMAGGWFFLTVCEAFTLGDQKFRLSGLGSYMAVAIERGNTHAMLAGFVAMILVIVFMDFVIWRPLIAWTRKFRIDEQAEQVQDIPFIQMLLKDSFIVKWTERAARSLVQRFSRRAHRQEFHKKKRKVQRHSLLRRLHRYERKVLRSTVLGWGLLLIPTVFLVFKFVHLLLPVSLADAVMILKSTVFTFLRVCLALVISTLWALPFGVWVGLSPKRTKFFQPIIQVAASFPAPMLYPLAIFVLDALGIGLGVGAGILMLLGVQWYVLFNVLAGATLISRELRDTFQMARVSRRRRWLDLYLPSVFPNLVTGWVTAAGGAWNASIVAEYIEYQGKTLQTTGLGALISEATASGNFPLLAGSLVAMVVVVVSFNRSVWHKVYALAERRYRFER